MLDLDFAFFNLNSNDKRGLVYRKYFLDRLGPVFFSPRVDKLIQLSNLNFRGCSISIPLGPANLSIIKPEKRQMMLERSTTIVQDYNLPSMAVDRRLKKQLLELSIGFPLIFGDNFIKALALAITANMLSRHEIKRIVIVGEVEYFPEFVSAICAYGVPLSIQTICPGQYEVMTYRLLYEKGYAVSTSALNPYSWEKGDLVFLFDPEKEGLAFAVSRAYCVQLTNNGQDLAPELENQFAKNGLVSKLYNLAPIMETCLLVEAGFLSSGGEQIRTNDISREKGRNFLTLQKVGDVLGLWDLFLDKAI
jgi:hypothetical protein